MHTLNRILTLLLLCVVLLPPATFAFVSLDDKTQTQNDLQQAIGSAVHTYQERGNLQNLKNATEKAVTQQKNKLATLEQQKLDLRRTIVKEKRIIATVGQIYGINITSQQELASIIETEKHRLMRLFQMRSLSQAASNPLDPNNVVLRMAFNVVSTEAGDSLLQETQTQMLRDLTAASNAFNQLNTLMPKRDTVLADYNAAQAQQFKAAATIDRSTEELSTIDGAMADVHDQVLKIQDQLSRIDAELKSKAERMLIAKGLLKPGDIDHSDATFHQQFSWPVYGIRTAGFMNAAYKKLFGVNHYGQDIAVSQGTPVAAAADGVVFIVRDGGEKGYSYILIGHRDGYATLYGHISKALVTAGQEVNVGQIIALSGGTPGMHGSGPMTTAAHLHFEVIKNGVNIDPMTVLP